MTTLSYIDCMGFGGTLPVFKVGLCAALLATAGCLGEMHSHADPGLGDATAEVAFESCRTEIRHIELLGEVSDSRDLEGSVRIEVVEQGTLLCGQTPGTITEITPGFSLGALSMRAPGAFSLVLELTEVQGLSSDLQLHVFADANDDGDCDPGERSLSRSLPPRDHRGLKLSLDGVGCAPAL